MRECYLLLLLFFGCAEGNTACAPSPHASDSNANLYYPAVQYSMDILLSVDSCVVELRTGSRTTSKINIDVMKPAIPVIT